MVLRLRSRERLNTIWSHILDQNIKNLTSLASIILSTDEMRFLEAMEAMLIIEYFYRHKFLLLIYTLISDINLSQPYISKFIRY